MSKETYFYKTEALGIFQNTSFKVNFDLIFPTKGVNHTLWCISHATAGTMKDHGEEEAELLCTLCR